MIYSFLMLYIIIIPLLLNIIEWIKIFSFIQFVLGGVKPYSTWNIHVKLSIQHFSYRSQAALDVIDQYDNLF